MKGRNLQVKLIADRYGVSPNVVDECIKRVGLQRDSNEEKKAIIDFLNRYDERSLSTKLYTPKSLQKEIFETCAKVFALAESKYPVKLNDVKIILKNMGRNAGLAQSKNGEYFLSLNPNYDHDVLLKETIPHETAHLVCFKLGTDFKHGPVWKRTTIELGGTGNTYYTQGPPRYRGKTYRYTDTTGRYSYVSSQIHTKIQKGFVYNCREGGKMDKTCSYVIV